MRLHFTNKEFSVFPLEEGELQDSKFHLGYYSIGFEDRSKFVAESLSSNCLMMIAVDLQAPVILSYSENLARAAKRGDRRIERSTISLVQQNIVPPDSRRDEVRLFIDVSSMDRRTLSVLLYHILCSSPAERTQLYVLYSPGKFTDPPRSLIPVQFSGAVNDLLGGQPRDPRLPTVIFVGLGYEVGLALGVVEAFEPETVFAYAPRGSDKRFDRQVDRVNLPLFSEGRYVSRVEYSVNAPANTFIDLKERILAVKDQARVVLVPLGPKLFSAISILCGYIYSPDICVWRVSSQINEATAQRYADGDIIGFRLQIISTSGTA
jgi:hypothetical protein